MRAIWMACKRAYYKTIAHLSLRIMEIFMADDVRFSYWGNKSIAYMGRYMDLFPEEGAA